MGSDVGVIILAAGLGTRMKSQKAKVLHDICGRPMIAYVVETAITLAGMNVVVVVGHQAEEVKIVVDQLGRVKYALQKEQLGTGHAVQCALPFIAPEVEDVVILCGDVPLIRPETIGCLIDAHHDGRHDVTLLAVEVENPKGYGRIILDAHGHLKAIVEEADADALQRSIKTINAGIYVVRRSFLEEVLPKLGADNAQGEIYLTDMIAIGYEEGKSIGYTLGKDSNEIIGVNSLIELQAVEKIMEVVKIQNS